MTHQDDQNIKNDKDGLYLPDYTRWDAAGYYTLSDDLEIRVNIRTGQMRSISLTRIARIRRLSERTSTPVINPKRF